MESMNKMLDAFHAMNVVIQRNANASLGVKSLLNYTTEERAQLCTRISHLLQGQLSPCTHLYSETDDF